MQKYRGKKDGEVKVFRNVSVAEAFVWKEAQNNWEKVILIFFHSFNIVRLVMF
jgi:hypothetical protein